MLLTTNNDVPGTPECRLNLAELYPDKNDRDAFEERWSSFCPSDETESSIYSRTESDILTYQTESFIPTKIDHRPPLLLLLGNPASHSVKARMCFAFEGNHHEHRFWRGLREAGLLDFKDAVDGEFVPDERNPPRNRQLFSLSYSSQFRIGITMYYTMPSAASGSPWSGVGGLRKLFGQPAFSKIEAEEQHRIAQIVESFIAGRGGVMAFQRDAYEAVRDDNGIPYSLDQAKAGQLISTYRHNPNVHVFGVAPTRFMLSGDTHAALERYKTNLLAALQG